MYVKLFAVKVKCSVKLKSNASRTAQEQPWQVYGAGALESSFHFVTPQHS